MEETGINLAYIIGSCISMTSVLVSIAMFYASVKERHARSASDAAEVKHSVENMRADIEELKSELKSATAGYHKNDKRIATLFERVENVEKRMDTLEATVNGSN